MPKYGSKSPPPEFTQAQLDYVDPDRPKRPQVKRPFGYQYAKHLGPWFGAMTGPFLFNDAKREVARLEEERRLMEEADQNLQIEMMAIEDKIRWRNQELERQRVEGAEDGRRSNNYHQPE